jgi:hypothetical protein
MGTTFQISNLKIDNLVINLDSRSGRRPDPLFVAINPDPTRPCPVRPNGKICALIRIDPEPGTTITAVKALVYRAGIFTQPDPDSQPPSDAVSGRSVGGNRWCWDGAADAPEIPGADSNAGGTAANVLAVWKTVAPSSTFVFDGYSTFSGITGIDVPCGSGSGSGSGSNVPAPIANQLPELAGAEALELTIESGKFKGRAKAIRVGPMTWEAKIEGQKFHVTLGQCAKRLVLHTPKGNVESHPFSQRPFKAEFPPVLALGDSKVHVTLP